ncbi:MAG: hypothetical protein AAF688_12940 [Bacteroidota bacterium]
MIANKDTGRYLKYALGEILLVVIGILIALQINNWNERRKSLEKENLLLVKLQEENNVNLETLVDDIEYWEDLPNTFDDFMEFLAKENIEEKQTQFKIYLSQILRATAYTFAQANLKNYITEHSDNQSNLTRELARLQNLQEDLIIVSEKSVDFKIDKFFTKVGSSFDFYSSEITSTDVFKTIEFRNQVYVISSYDQEVQRKFFDSIEQLKKVDSLVNLRLKR